MNPTHDLSAFIDRCELRQLNDIQVIKEARTEYAGLEKSAAADVRSSGGAPNPVRDQYVMDLKALVFFLEHAERPLDVTTPRFQEIEAYARRLLQARRLGLAARYFLQQRIRR